MVSTTNRGPLKTNKNGGYNLRPHSLSKFFDTKLKAHQTPDDFVQHMLGHLTDKYNIQSLGIEFLRNIYAKGGLPNQTAGQPWGNL